MLNLENILSPQMIQRIGWMLMHFTWQATAVTMVLAILLRILRRFSANLRYTVACMGLLLIVLMPALTIGLIKVSTPAAPVQTESVIDKPVVTSNEAAPEAFVPAQNVTFNNTLPEPVYRKAGPNYKQKVVSFLEPKLNIIVALWLLGVFALSIRNLGGLVQLHRLRLRMVRPVDESLRNKLKELSGILGIHRVVELMESALVQAPTAIGCLKPVILMPSSALTGLSPEQIEGILAHELAHIKRYDYLINILQTVVETLGFYHPAVWWISKNIRLERENCCDDIAVKLTGDRIGYAKTLASFGEIQASRPELAVAATGGSLFSRISRLLGKDSTEKSFFSLIPAATDIMILAALVMLISNIVLAQTPTVLELLDKHKETREKLTNSFIVKFELTRNGIRFATDNEPPVQTDNTETKFYKYEFRYDGKQFNQRNFSWGELGTIWPNQTRTITDVPENEARYYSLYDANCGSITYSRGKPGILGKLTFVHERQNAAKAHMTGAMGSWLYGYWDNTSIDELLRNPESEASVREKTEEIEGSQCYVINADTNRGKFTIWLDPAHGYNIAREEVIVEEGDIRGSSTHQEGDRLTETISNVKFRQIDGVWVPWESVVEGVSDSKRYSYHITDKQTYKTTEFIIDPNHEALGSFEPDDILNGASVIVRGAEGISCKWQDGKVVDSLGSEVNKEYLDSLTPISPIIRTPISLVGKPLPSLNEFNVNLNPELTDNKKLLICFWDVNQRPSRNYILTLNRQAQELSEKDIYMVFVQAEPADEQTLASWLRDNQIQAYAGTSKASISELQYSWGAQALPWLILTDTDHIVTAEGFSINELDNKIQQ